MLGINWWRWGQVWLTWRVLDPQCFTTSYFFFHVWKNDDRSALCGSPLSATLFLGCLRQFRDWLMSHHFSNTVGPICKPKNNCFLSSKFCTHRTL